MIPVNEPHLTDQEQRYVSECVASGWISSTGRFVDAFEASWARYCGMSYGVAVSNGTAALEVAVACLDLRPGDEVIIPAFTIISCAAAVLRNGGVPVLIDSDPLTWCMDVSQLESRITPRTRSIMPVHIYGHPVDMDPVLELAHHHGLCVIEDAAEAHGAEYRSACGAGGSAWRRCGGMGHVSAFSFYANKLVTTGEGGMVLTNDRAVAERMRGLRNLCFRTDRRFYHTELGYNYRLTNVQAAIGLAQVERIDGIVARKRWMGQAYTERLRDIPTLQLPVEKSWAKSVFWMYGLVLDESTGMTASELAAKLKQHGVETRPFFLGMHEQPVLKERGLFGGERYPVAERLARQGLYLPSGTALTDAQIDAVCAAIHTILT